MTPSDHSDISPMRASDADRDRAAAIISTALAEGRLTPEEHSERLDLIYAARTHADLAPLVHDLPDHHEAAVTAGRPAGLGGTDRGQRMVAILSGISRKGNWHVEPVMEILTVLGGADIDFRYAALPAREITIHVVSVLGGVDITVPPEMRVIDAGAAILGGREIAGNSAESARPDAPVLHITGRCVLGGIEVRRKPRKNGKGRTWPAIGTR